MQILFFARFRQILGKSGLEVDPPGEVQTVRQLIDWLKLQSQDYEAVFANERIIRVAVDRSHVSFESPITGAQEIAFFPPVTGG